MTCSFPQQSVRKKKDGLFNLKINGDIGENLESNFGYKFEAEFKTELKSKIDRNINYFLVD